MTLSVMRAIGLVLACIPLASHTRRVKTDFEQERGSSRDKGEDSQWLVDKHAASGSFLAEAKQSLLQQKVESLSPFRKLALLLLVLHPAAAFQLPGASRSFATMQRGLNGRAPVQSGNHGRVVMQDGGADFPADSAPDATVPIDVQVQTSGADSPADIEPDANVLTDDGWQVELDKALLDLDLQPSERLELLQKALSDPSVLADVQEALSIVQDKGFMVGHPEAIEKLFPSGTQSRSDLEGLTALRKQVPEAFEELQKQVQELLPKVLQLQEPSTRGSSVRIALDKGQPSTRALDKESPSLPDPLSVLQALKDLAFDSEKQRELQEGAKELLRSTPKGLETPSYEVVRVLEGPIFLGKPQPIEIRDYEEFTVALTRMKEGAASAAEGQGFNTLASYLFGQNQPKTAMAMTVPVDTSFSADNSNSSMSFVLPKEFAESPPTPLEGSGVEIVKVPARLVAAKVFSGIVTQKEVERQKAALLEALEKNSHYVPVDAGQVSVLQYNQPLAIPWRRRNEVAIVVTEKTAADSSRMDYPDYGVD